MYFLFYFATFFYTFTVSHAENNTDDNGVENLNVNDIAESLVSFLTIYNDESKTNRFKELREKLQTIDKYAVDKDKYMDLLINETKTTDLNATNFYDALNEQDHFELVKEDSKNLYLTMKERMNRDDVLQILAERGRKKMMKSARRMMNDGFMPKTAYEKVVDDVVDKIIAESPHDSHKYNESEHKYWDPEPELRELNEHHKHDGRRIFRGERTNVRYYPFMVSVHVMGRFWCGGVLYWHDLVLTSAACLQLMHNNRFFRENPRILAVRMGSNHSRIGGEVIDALEVFFHPGYNPRTLRNNIAVIRLRRHLRFGSSRIPRIIDISHQEGGLPATAEVMLLGWGVTKTSQKMAYEPIFLQRKFLPVYPNMFCKEVYGSKFIHKTMFCAGTMSTGEGACDHDAGGPAIMAGKLVGIISFGPTLCGYPNVPTVFTLVGAYADWIETINETMPGYYRGVARTTTTTPFPIPDIFTQTQYQQSTTQKPTTEPQLTTSPATTTTTSAPAPTPPALRMGGFNGFDLSADNEYTTRNLLPGFRSNDRFHDIDDMDLK